MGLFRKLRDMKGGDATPPHAPGSERAEVLIASPAGDTPKPTPAPDWKPVESAPAATAPVPEPHAAVPAHLLKDFGEKLTQVLKSTEAERLAVQDFAEKVNHLENRVQRFQVLFEGLSLKYNPFLGKEEPELFDGHWKPPVEDNERQAPAAVGASLPHAPPPGHDGTGAGTATDAAAEPGTLASLGLAPGEPSGNGKHAPPGAEARGPQGGPTSSPAPVPHPWPPGSPAATPMAPTVRTGSSAPPGPSPAYSVHVPPSLGSRGASGGPRLAPWGGAAVQGTRESYLVLSWFDYMFRTVEPARVYQFLDFYLELGWITQEVYEWFHHLALSIAPLPPNVARLPANKGRKISPRELVRLHKTSLRFFDYLFRINLSPGESRRLERAVEGLVRRG